MTGRAAGRAIEQWRTRFETALVPARGSDRPRFRREEHDLVSLLLARAAGTPDHPCLSDGITGETFTYAAVERRVLTVAGHLRQRGFQPGDRLALIDPASPASVIVLLATLAAGGVAVPLNERLHPSELSSLLASVRPRAIATGRATVDFWPSEDLILIDPAAAISEVSNTAPSFDPFVPAPEAWAFILHTGGTTGQPKSVVLSHDAVTQNLTFFRLGLGLDQRDRALVAAPLFHVTGLMAQVLHMVEVGGTSILLPRFDARTFLDVAASTGATYSCVVPTVVRLLLQELRDGRGGETLRLLLYGGAPMDPATLTRFAERLPQVGLVNTYGATETCGSATFLPADLAAGHPTSVGFESPVVQLTLGGERTAGSGEGGFAERGIIAMAGASTSPGYLVWDGDEATVTPFPPGGWSSGDEGGRDTDGFLHILGRVDDIVNKGGEKIHPEEIERYLLAHDAVVEAAVCGVPDALFGQELLAAVVARPGWTLSDEEVRAHLSRFVGRFKVPRYIEVVSELPRTPAGKINKRAIAAAQPTRQGQPQRTRGIPMTTGRLLADWVTELCDADRAPTAAEVFLHAAASLPALGALPPGLEGTLIEGCRVTVRDDSPFDGTPTPPDWLFAHPEQFDTAPGPGPTVLVHRLADGSVRISADDDDDDDDRGRPGATAGAALVDGDAAATLVTQAGLVWRLATAGVALGAVSEEIGQEIDTSAAATAAGQWTHRREYDALATTERFFQYTAALAALLAACQSVTTGRGGASAVASTELLVAALAGGGPRGSGPALDPAWAQAELASACR